MRLVSWFFGKLNLLEAFVVFTVGALLLILSYNVQAATLAFDASTGEVDGYIAYCSDGVNEYNINIGNVTEFPNIEEEFGLEPNIEYAFTVTAYNEYGESPRSNVALYTWVLPTTFTPPEDNVMPKKVYILGPVQQVIVNPTP